MTTLKKGMVAGHGPVPTSPPPPSPPPELRAILEARARQVLEQYDIDVESCKVIGYPSTRSEAMMYASGLLWAMGAAWTT